MHVLEGHNDVWVTAVINGRWVQAKVYMEPSDFGINGGKVSKMAVGKTSTRDPSRAFFDQMDFNYDRGLDFSNLPESMVNSIVEQLENWRTTHPYQY